jgi:NADH:ubiquinone oxidoreductase subunit E
MVTIAICVGSSCHLKGSYEVIEGFRDEVDRRHLIDKIELKAAFCLGKCGCDGVTVAINGKIITGVKKENLASLFDAEVMPLLQGATSL